jgi:uncharacterized repeat protein (TIGR02543 family)
MVLVANRFYTSKKLREWIMRRKLFVICILVFIVAMLAACNKGDIIEGETFKLTLDANGGAFSEGQESYVINSDGKSAVTLPGNPAKTGYTFNGWYLEAECTTAAADIIGKPISNDITLYAGWTANKYTFTFVSNGGNNIAPVTADYGTEIAPPEPHKEGYSFAGWYTDNGTFDEAYNSWTVPAANLTLYADWTINSYTIDFESNGGGNVASITQDYNTAVAAPAAPTRQGHKFLGWYTDDSFSEEYAFSTMPAENITLYAKWLDLDDVYKRVNAAGEPDANGDFILFGEYPQTVKAAGVTVGTEADERGYFLGSDGYYYAQVTATPDPSGGYTFSTGAAVEEGTAYYFKVEPIKWRILSQSNGSALILCESIIANMRFDENSNNYEESEVRAWLIGEFYNTAFNQLERQFILLTEVDNSVESTGYDENPYACENTLDKVFLLSYLDTINSEYGFCNFESRERITSDYSRATGAQMVTESSNFGNGWWWLRSPNNGADDRAWHINLDGDICEGNVSLNGLGTVPALWIQLN